MTSVIPSPKYNPNNKGKIPDSVALNPYKGDPEEKPFHISYEYYNDRQCEMTLLEKNNSRAFLKDLRTIGKCNARTLKDNNILTETVTNKGDYSRLFSNLPEDVDTLREHKGNGTSRLFYFYAGRVLYIIAITQNHLETRKQR